MKGLQEFRGVEKQAIGEQERVRLSAKQLDRIERTHQPEFFSASSFAGAPSSFQEERASQFNTAANRLRALLRSKAKIKYEDILGFLLEMPLVWESDIQQIIKDLRQAGELSLENLKPRERTIKPGHVLVWTKPH